MAELGRKASSLTLPALYPPPFPKALEAMKVGAVGLIIVDDDKNDNQVDREPQRVMATEEQTEAIRIPTVMAVHSFWRDLFYQDNRQKISGPALYGLGVTEG